MVLDNEGQHESRWSAIMSISAKIGCAPQMLNEWVKKAEADRGERAGVMTECFSQLLNATLFPGRGSGLFLMQVRATVALLHRFSFVAHG
jgi:hypothetical protein